jgi:hypothetical protein
MTTSRIYLDNLEDIARRLGLQWEATTQLWHDKIQQDFAEQYYAPLQHEHRIITKHAAALIEVLQRVQQTVR